MNLLEIRTKVRDEIKDATTQFFSDAQINDYINQAQNALADVARIKIYWTANLVANQSEYTLPSEAISVEAIEVDADGNSDYEVYDAVDYKEALQGNVSDKWWYVRGRELTIGETPSADVTNGLRLHGIKTPDILTQDTDTTEMGVKYDWTLVYFAVMRCFERRESFDKAAYYEGKFLKERQQMIEDMDTLTEGGIMQMTGRW